MPPSTSQNINVLSFNVRCENSHDGPNAWVHRKQMAARVFGEHRVDLAGLQEAQAGQIEDLQARLPTHGWTGVGRDDGGQSGEFSPIFYDRQKYSVASQGTFWLSETPEVPGSRGWDAALPRIATWGIFCDKFTDEKVFFINTHFDHKGEQARQRSARLLLQQISRLHTGLPVILTGDFNCAPDSPAIRTLTEQSGGLLADARQITATPHVGADQSFNGFRPDGADIVIDYIFVSPLVRALSHGYYRAIEDGVFVSDHWPVVSEVSLTESR